MAPYRLLHELDGVTDDDQILMVLPSTAWTGIQFIRIETISSPSWIAWREVEVISSDQAH